MSEIKDTEQFHGILQNIYLCSWHLGHRCVCLHEVSNSLGTKPENHDRLNYEKSHAEAFGEFFTRLKKQSHACAPISNKTASKTNSLTVQGDFDRIVDVGNTELCFLSV